MTAHLLGLKTNDRFLIEGVGCTARGKHFRKFDRLHMIGGHKHKRGAIVSIHMSVLRHAACTAIKNGNGELYQDYVACPKKCLIDGRAVV